MADEGFDARLTEVRERIRAAAERAGRDPAGVRLLAVSKTRSADEIRAAVRAGQFEFGENYAQELATKREELADVPGIRWHMIGHLQRNKVKLVVPGTDLLETVDSTRLVGALDRRLAEADGTLDVLVQVNVGGEERKSGADLAETPDVIAAIRSSSRLRLRGLMCIPPLTFDAGESRPWFRGLRELSERLGLGEGERELSMGMSDTYEAAVEEGATIVRVGTFLFGPRG